MYSTLFVNLNSIGSCALVWGGFSKKGCPAGSFGILVSLLIIGIQAQPGVEGNTARAKAAREAWHHHFVGG
jgi:hypothetical protein